MPFRLLFHSLAVLLLFFASVIAAQCVSSGLKHTFPHAVKLKAVQILVLEDATLEELRPRLRSWREAGFDTVILRAFHLPGDRAHGPAALLAGDDTQGVYFPTSEAPVIMDIMSPFAAICRDEGLKPFAWMVTRDARFGKSRLPSEIIYYPPSGILRPTPHLDVLDPEVLSYLERLFSDLGRTGVEGILLQDDLASRMTEGFTAGNLLRYREETGDDLSPYHHLKRITDQDGRSYLRATPAFYGWVYWKTRHLVFVARRLQDAVTAAAPETALVMNQMYEALTDPENGRLWLSQDLGTTIREGPPYAAVMLYHRQMQNELGLSLSDTFGLIRQSLNALPIELNSPRIILKFQTHDWTKGKTVPPEDLLSALMTVRDGEWSLAFFPPPTEEQMKTIEPVLKGMLSERKR
jgi:hypothetical protein